MFYKHVMAWDVFKLTYIQAQIIYTSPSFLTYHATDIKILGFNEGYYRKRFQ